MVVLIYGTQASIVTDRLRKAIEGAVPRGWVEEYHTCESLSFGLRRPLIGRAIAVLLALNLQDLMGLLSIDDLLSDIPIILILLERDAKTISKAHALRPRYLTFADIGFEDVAAVLGKMVDHMEPGTWHCRKKDRKEKDS